MSANATDHESLPMFWRWLDGAPPGYALGDAPDGTRWATNDNRPGESAVRGPEIHRWHSINEALTLGWIVTTGEDRDHDRYCGRHGWGCTCPLSGPANGWTP